MTTELLKSFLDFWEGHCEECPDAKDDLDWMIMEFDNFIECRA